jgi:hypothetical protein
MSKLELLKIKAKLIAILINDNEIFSSELKVEIDEKRKPYQICIITFKLDDANFSTTEYFLNSDGILQGHIIGVYSNQKGMQIGSFLLQLQLLVAFLGNATSLKLENYTDEPARAAKKTGIYGDFTPKLRSKDKVKKDLAEQLKISEGDMVLILNGDNRRITEQKIKSIVTEQKDKDIPLLSFWNKFDKIDTFLRQLHQHVGGKKKSRKQTQKKHRSNHIKNKRSSPSTACSNNKSKKNYRKRKHI